MSKFRFVPTSESVREVAPDIVAEPALLPSTNQHGLDCCDAHAMAEMVQGRPNWSHRPKVGFASDSRPVAVLLRTAGPAMTGLMRCNKNASVANAGVAPAGFAGN
jgi:hypothetical protein